MKCNQSRIWTRVAVSNSCNDNHYTTGSPRHGSGWVCLGTGDFLWPQGVVLLRLLPSLGEGGYCLAPIIGGMPTGPKVFLAMLDACGLQPCDRTHLKNGLVSYLSGGGADDKYQEFLHLQTGKDKHRFLLHPAFWPGKSMTSRDSMGTDPSGLVSTWSRGPAHRQYLLCRVKFITWHLKKQAFLHLPCMSLD